MAEPLVEEVDHVEECPADECDVVLVGVSPQEYREKHVPDCPGGPLMAMYCWPTEEARRRQEEKRHGE